MECWEKAQVDEEGKDQRWRRGDFSWRGRELRRKR